MHLDPTAQRRLLRVRGRARAASERPVSANVHAYLTGQPAQVAPSEDASEAPDGAERRRCGRVALNSNILVRRLGGFNFDVALRDVSTGGCRVELLEPCEVGDPVIARLPQLEPLGSRVCWARGTTTGVQFLTSLHPAVFDALLPRLPAPE
jgi:hypothetical protein